MTNFKQGQKLIWEPNKGPLANQTLVFVEYAYVVMGGRLAVVRDEKGNLHQVSPMLLKEAK